jgi:acyl carrier protein
MAPDELRARLRTVMADAFETTPEALPAHANTDNVEKWDSLGHLILIESLEAAFGVTFDHGETLNMLSEDDALTHLAARLGAVAELAAAD